MAPFQDYGSSEVYIWSNLPLGLISLTYAGTIINFNAQSNFSTNQLAILTLIAVDISCIAISSIINKLKVASRVNSIDLKDSALLDGFMTDFSVSKNVADKIPVLQTIITIEETYLLLQISRPELHRFPYGSVPC